MKEEWLLDNAVVPVDVETTASLVAEIHRLIGVVGGMALARPEPDWGAVGEAHLVSLKRDMRRSLEDAVVRATHKVMAELEQEPVAWEQFYPEMGKPKLAYLPPTESTENACYTTPQPAPVLEQPAEQDSTCSNALRIQGKAYPRTCKKCGLGPCIADRVPPAQQEPNKDGSPCPEFWDWLPKAYNFDCNGAFTKYNMEVAFLAGKQASQPAQRTWVGLTDEELDKLAVDAGIITWVKKVYDNIDRQFYDLPLGEGMTGDAVCLKQFARLVEEALKKKNS